MPVEHTDAGIGSTAVAIRVCVPLTDSVYFELSVTHRTEINKAASRMSIL